MKIQDAVAVLVLVAVAACGGDEQGMEFDGDVVQEARADWPEGLSETMDQGNLAFREGDYQQSADIFRSATEEHPDIGAAWFGLYMAERALGNGEAADRALARANELTPGLPEVHPGASQGGMPAGHPALPTDSGGMPGGHPQIAPSDTPAMPAAHP